MTPSRIGAVLGGISIGFSTLCFAITPVFTPAFLLAALFGLLSAALALALKARRTALVALVFAATPFCGLLLIDHVVERVRNGYVAFIPLAAAFVVASWALLDYSRRKRNATKAVAS